WRRGAQGTEEETPRTRGRPPTPRALTLAVASAPTYLQCPPRNPLSPVRHGFRVLCGCGRLGQCCEASRTLARNQGAQTVLSETELGPLHARGSVRVGRCHQGRSAPEPATGR